MQFHIGVCSYYCVLKLQIIYNQVIVNEKCSMLIWGEIKA